MLRAEPLQDTARPRAITELAAAVKQLPPGERGRFERLIHISESTGVLVAPSSMHKWIEGFFGSVQAVERQKIVKTTNLVTFEGTLFNALRSNRPMESELPEQLDEIVTGGSGDPFCRPEEGTPEDLFGRVRGAHAITASNVAKYDAFHGVVIYEHHNPMSFSREAIVDYLDVGLR